MSDTEDSLHIQEGPLEFEFPAEWDADTVESLFNLVNGVNYESENYVDSPDDGYPFLSLKSIQKGGGYRKDGIKYYNDDINPEKFVEPGEVLLAKTDVTQDALVVGRPLQVPKTTEGEKVTASMDLAILRGADNIFDRTFLSYLFQSEYPGRRMKGLSAGTTVLHLNTSLLKKLSLPIPSRVEQERIASVLYVVDQMIDTTQQLINKHKTASEAYVWDTLLGVVDSTGALQELEGDPRDGWEVKRIGEFISEFHYGDSLTEDTRISGDVPVFGSNGQVDTHNESYIDEPGIVIGRKGSTGEVHYSDKPFYPIDTTYYITQQDTDYDLRFVEILLDACELGKVGAHTAIPGLNRNTAKRLKVCIPTSEEDREEITSVIHQYRSRIQALSERNEKLQLVKTALMQDLLSGEVRTPESLERLDDVVTQ